MSIGTAPGSPGGAGDKSHLTSGTDTGGGGVSDSGGVLDFLFNGKAPPSVSSYGTATTGVPQWLSDYLQGTASKANALGAEQFQVYGAPRIAGLAPQQNEASAITQGNVGSWQPGFNTAGDAFSASAQNNASAAGQPWLNQAGGTFPGAVDSYMSPYMSHVTDRAAMLGQRNLTENLLPAMGDTFIRAGQHGSTRHIEEMGKALRNTQEGITSQQLAALDQGFGRAGQLHGQDMSRLAGIGQTAGNLATQTADDLRATGSEWMGLGRNTQSAGLTDAAALDAVGNQMRGFEQANLDLAHQDFADQRDYPRNTIDWLSSVVRGMPSPGSSVTTSGTRPASRSDVPPTSGLSSIVGALQMGNLFGKAEGGYIPRYAKGGGVIDADFGPPPLATYARKHSGPAMLREAARYARGGYAQGGMPTYGPPQAGRALPTPFQPTPQQQFKASGGFRRPQDNYGLDGPQGVWRNGTTGMPAQHSQPMPPPMPPRYGPPMPPRHSMPMPMPPPPNHGPPMPPQMQRQMQMQPQGMADPNALDANARRYAKGGYVKPPRYAYGGRVPDSYVAPARRGRKPSYKRAC
jgi:hypothetical protein